MYSAARNIKTRVTQNTNSKYQSSIGRVSSRKLERESINSFVCLNIYDVIKWPLNYSHCILQDHALHVK